jgi:hypothetical protein
MVEHIINQHIIEASLLEASSTCLLWIANASGFKLGFEVFVVLTVIKINACILVR